MKDLFIYMLCMLMASCTFEIVPLDDTDTSVSYEYNEDYEEIIVYAPCMYDPLPYDYPMRYCTTYDDAECCMWEDWGESWECSYEWCFYWDTCSWDYVDSECWW
jgi:hypothetical protein